MDRRSPGRVRGRYRRRLLRPCPFVLKRTTMKFQKMAQTDTFKTADQLGLCIPRYVKITERCFISSLSPPDIGTWRKTDINVSATVQQAYGMGKTIWGVIRAGQQTKYLSVFSVVMYVIDS